MRIHLWQLVIVVFCSLLVAGWVDPVFEQNEEGLRLYEEEKYKESIARLSSIKEKTDEPAIVHFNLGNAYYKLKDYDSAIQEYFLSAKSAEKQLREQIYYNLGNCQFYRGDLEKSLHYFKKAINLDPEDRDARINYEYVLSKLNDGGQSDVPGQNGQGDNSAGEIPITPDSREYFIDERDRQVIYEMLEAEERSKRKKVRFRDDTPENEKGKNW